MQTPFIGNLLSQIEASKLTDEKIKKHLGKAPSTRDIKLKQRKDQFRKFSNINSNDDSNNLPPLPISLPPPPSAAFFSNLGNNPPSSFLLNFDKNDGNNDPVFPNNKYQLNIAKVLLLLRQKHLI